MKYPLKTPWRRAAALVLALLLTLALAGCQQTAAGDGEALTTVRLNEVTHSVFYAPQYAAMELGFFAEEGLAIELTNGGGADKVMTAVLTGGSDIGLAGPEAAIYVHKEGREDACIVFGQLTKRDGAFLVGREPEPDFAWENLAGSYVIGGRAGGVPLMTLEHLLRSKGLIPGEDLTVDSSVQFNMMAGAFTGGTGDYVALFEPTASQMEQEGKGHILASIGEAAGEVPYTAYFAAESFLAENADLVERFTRAVHRGQQWVAEHTAAEIAEVIAPQFPDTDLALLTTVTERHKQIDAWNQTPVMEQAAFERLQDIMQEAGELDARVPFAEVVDNSFALAASAG
ncbi:MAG: ABC transporter substrate-binding protein [Clostridia bacterium]|nr:ABC transporter substrate-binding protein [Clostridia bacterium]